jgi:translation initiation factor IF-3
MPVSVYNKVCQEEVCRFSPAFRGIRFRTGRFSGGDIRSYAEAAGCPQFFMHTFRRCVRINDLMINEEIRDREVRVIDENGTQLGAMPTANALSLAEERQLDLVKIAPTSKPPVCKLMDYGKYRFEQSKRAREIRKNQKVITVKEVRLSATIEDHDIDVKRRAAIKFLGDGDKVKVAIRFRGRQIAHSEIGLEVMQKFAESIKEHAIIERRPLMEGRNMSMILAPRDKD